MSGVGCHTVGYGRLTVLLTVFFIAETMSTQTYLNVILY